MWRIALFVAGPVAAAVLGGAALATHTPCTVLHWQPNNCDPNVQGSPYTWLVWDFVNTFSPGWQWSSNTSGHGAGVKTQYEAAFSGTQFGSQVTWPQGSFRFEMDSGTCSSFQFACLTAIHNPIPNTGGYYLTSLEANLNTLDDDDPNGRNFLHPDYYGWSAVASHEMGHGFGLFEQTHSWTDPGPPESSTITAPSCEGALPGNGTSISIMDYPEIDHSASPDIVKFGCDTTASSLVRYPTSRDETVIDDLYKPKPPTYVNSVRDSSDWGTLLIDWGDYSYGEKLWRINIRKCTDGPSGLGTYQCTTSVLDTIIYHYNVATYGVTRYNSWSKSTSTPDHYFRACIWSNNGPRGSSLEICEPIAVQLIN